MGNFETFNKRSKPRNENRPKSRNENRPKPKNRPKSGGESRFEFWRRWDPDLKVWTVGSSLRKEARLELERSLLPRPEEISDISHKYKGDAAYAAVSEIAENTDNKDTLAYILEYEVSHRPAAVRNINRNPDIFKQIAHKLHELTLTDIIMQKEEPCNKDILTYLAKYPNSQIRTLAVNAIAHNTDMFKQIADDADPDLLRRIGDSGCCDEEVLVGLARHPNPEVNLPAIHALSNKHLRVFVEIMDDFDTATLENIARSTRHGFVLEYLIKSGDRNLKKKALERLRRLAGQPRRKNKKLRYINSHGKPRRGPHWNARRNPGGRR